MTKEGVRNDPIDGNTVEAPRLHRWNIIKNRKDREIESKSAALYGVFDLGDQPTDDVPSDVIERLSVIDPCLSNNIMNGRAKVNFDFEMKGALSTYRFDATISCGNQLTLVQYYRGSKEIAVVEVEALRSNIFDVCDEMKFKQIQLIIVGAKYTSSGMDFISKPENWQSTNCDITRSLIRISENGYRVILTSHDNLTNYKDSFNSITSVDTKRQAIWKSQIPMKWRAISAVAIAIVVVLSTLSIYLMNESDNYPTGGIKQVGMGITSITAGNLTIVVYSCEGLPKINETSIWIYDGANLGNNDNIKLAFEPFGLSLLTPGVYYHGTRFNHTTDPNFYNYYNWVNRSSMHAGDYLNPGDYFTLNTTIIPNPFTFALYDGDWMMGSVEAYVQHQ